jgi:fumarate reductase iron-sulfur subunit
MVVNGRPRWTCRTRVSEAVEAGGTLRLEPLRNFTVVKDLAVEMTQFFDKWLAALSACFAAVFAISLVFIFNLG